MKTIALILFGTLSICLNACNLSHTENTAPDTPDRIADRIKYACSMQRDLAAYDPPSAPIPNAASAIAIAEPILIAEYDKKLIEREKPFKVSHYEDKWLVTGKDLPTHYKGGVAMIVLSDKTGKILCLLHGQ